MHPTSNITTAAYILRYKSGFNIPESNLRLRELVANEDVSGIFTRADIQWAEDALGEHEKLGIHVLSILDPEYPYLLRQIPDPPTIIFVRGNLDALMFVNSVAIVGTRQATPNGLTIARRISGYLASLGWTITSGLALGIDAAAHEGCIAAGGRTIAVLAHGLERAQPKQNQLLAGRILESGGLWLSEHPMGVSPRPSFFVQRNRLQIGLSAGSIIVEAGLKSGSSTQARLCREQNRPLFAVVPENSDNPLNLFSEGTLEFVRSSDAIPIHSRKDYSLVIDTLDKSLKRLLHLGIGATNGYPG